MNPYSYDVVKESSGTVSRSPNTQFSQCISGIIATTGIKVMPSLPVTEREVVPSLAREDGVTADFKTFGSGPVTVTETIMRPGAKPYAPSITLFMTVVNI